MLGGLLGAYLFAEKASREQSREIQSKLDRIRAARLKSAKTAVERARELEDDLARVALLARALAELCLKKGLLTRAELGAMLAEVDLVDGAGDGGLDPSMVMPGKKQHAQPDRSAPRPARVRRTRKPR